MDKKNKNTEEQKSKKEIVSIVPTKTKGILVDPLNAESESLVSLDQKEVVPEEVNLTDVNGIISLETNNIFQEVGTNYSSQVYSIDYIENNNFIGGNNMSCKSMISTVNSASTAVTVGSTIPLGSITRRFGNKKGCPCVPALDLSGSNSIIVRESGYYDIDITATFTVPTAGNVTLTVFVNGVAVPGLTATTTVTTDSTQISTLNINAPDILVQCASVPATITIVLSGVAATFSNISVSVKKL